MITIRYVHWKAAEAEERADRIRQLGFEVDADACDGPACARALRESLPDAVVIDLARLPSHGRHLGEFLRQGKRTRGLPLVYVGGEAAKVERVRESLPDAAFCDWEELAEAVQTAIAAPRSPAASAPTGIATAAPLRQKLGLPDNAAVALIDAPAEVEQALTAAAPDVEFRPTLRGKHELVVWCVRHLADWEKKIDRMAAHAGQGRLWIVWPKQAGERAADVNLNRLRRRGRPFGLIDFKVCSLCDDWSAARFTLQKSREKVASQV